MSLTKHLEEFDAKQAQAKAEQDAAKAALLQRIGESNRRQPEQKVENKGAIQNAIGSLRRVFAPSKNVVNQQVDAPTPDEIAAYDRNDLKAEYSFGNQNVPTKGLDTNPTGEVARP
jgi:hypothetical protein